MMTITDRFINALAAVVHEIRPTWDEQGIAAMIRKAAAGTKARDDAQLATVAIRAAADVTNRTPAVIPLDGDHWIAPVKPIERPLTSGPTCEVCRTCTRLVVPGEDHRCRVERSGRSEAVKAARQAAEEGHERAEAIRVAGDAREREVRR